MRCSSDGTGYLALSVTRRLFAVGLVVVVFPAAAAAHAVLLRTVPADRAVSPTPLHQVLVVFDGPVQVGPGKSVVRDGGGSVLAAAPIPRSVRWSIISDDLVTVARSVVYDQRIAATLAPPRFSHDNQGGAQAVVIGTRRLDRLPGAPRTRSTNVDRWALHVIRLQMTAAAHFMHVRYVSWNGSASIRPPTG